MLHLLIIFSFCTPYNVGTRFDYEIFDIFSTDIEGGWLDEVNSTLYASDRARTSEPISIPAEIHVKLQFLFIVIFTLHCCTHICTGFELLHVAVVGQVPHDEWGVVTA